MEMPTTSGPARQLKCNCCGWVLGVTADDLHRFSRGKWPSCCVVAMVLEVDGHSVGPSEDTELERPTRRFRRRHPD
jgi:hypothetical protein